jgi:hypothetical protein
LPVRWRAGHALLFAITLAGLVVGVLALVFLVLSYRRGKWHNLTPLWVERSGKNQVFSMPSEENILSGKR